MKNIWILNQYITSPEIEGDGYRHYYIAKRLKEHGYNTLLVTSSFSHAPYRHNKFFGLYNYVNKGVPTLILKGNKYGTASGLGRIFSWIVFAVQLLILPLLGSRKAPRPDIIMLSSLPLLPILNISILKLFYPKSKFVFEIRDLWPLSGIELGGYSPRNPFMMFLAYLEKLAYKKADLIISVIPRADTHIADVLGDQDFKFKWITNGYEIPKVDTELNLKEVLDVNIDPEDFNIGYAGTLVVANPLDTIISVVGRHTNRKIKLYILGGGPERDRLVELAEEYDNVHVLNRVPKKYVASFLAQMNLLFMGKGGKDTKVYEFGTSQLKTFDYFFAKKPIIQALNSKENPVTYSGAGFVIEPEDEHELKEKIDYFASLSQADLEEYGRKGYEYLIANCTYDIIGEKFYSAFEEL